MEISWLQTQADDAERKLAGVPKEIAATKTAALVEYQSSAEFEQVWEESFDDGICTFIYNIWHEHPECDLFFLGEAAREMVVEFNAPSRPLSLTLLRSSCLQLTSLLRSLIGLRKLSMRTPLRSQPTVVAKLRRTMK